ncbi:glycoside hydrolase family 76 [Stylonychia lemnae]|uniref:Glycoside hydrolase family 76 n=1 Tax=Stylonychia lemnae TaxID=5949 RepID=A0A078A0U7_STYLE|nr:glycoside hydrolase family 76 [Stylonychia lemnae]|eukprot:CDW75760.1 glycoside hydrolase family 76 [Stylonychia lemnae]
MTSLNHFVRYDDKLHNLLMNYTNQTIDLNTRVNLQKKMHFNKSGFQHCSSDKLKLCSMILGFYMKLGQFYQSFFFNYLNFFTIIDELQVDEDILRIEINTNCFDVTLTDLLSQATSRNYLELDIGNRYYNLVKLYLSTAYYYDLYPHLFKFYKLREIYSYIKVESITNSTVQFSVSSLRLVQWNQTYKMFNNLTVDNETQRLIMQKSLDLVQENLNVFFLQNVYTLKSVMAEGSWFAFQVMISNMRILKLIKRLPRNATNNMFYMQTRAFIENKVFNPDELLFSSTLKHRNQWFWTSIRGSDDNGWAALALLYAADIDLAFKESYLNYTGQYYELGVRQILNKINEVYRDQNGNVFWLESRDPYYSSISTTLTIILNQRMYLLTNETKFLNQSLFDYKYIIDRPYLFNHESLLMDGSNLDLSYFDESVYSYTQEVPKVRNKTCKEYDNLKVQQKLNHH